MNFELKTQKELSEMTEEQINKYQSDLEVFRAEQMKSNVANAVKDSIDKAQNDLKEFLSNEIKNQITEFSAMRISNKEKANLRAQLKAKHEEIIDCVKSKKGFEIELKAPQIHATNNGVVSNVSVHYPNTDNFMVDDEVAKIRYPENFILNVISNRQVNNVPAQIIKKEQAQKNGEVAVVTEGEIKPNIVYFFVRTTTERVKYAAHIEWTEEFAMDFEMLFAEVVRIFEEDVIRAWQKGILDQITVNATTYVGSTLDGTLVAPDNGLAVVATQSQIQALNYNPDVVIMNPADLVATLFSQDADGNLKLSPYINVTAQTINGMRLYQSNHVTQGTALVGDSTTYREIHSNYIFRDGRINDQLITNEYTAVGEVFSILSIAERDLVSWVNVDLEAVKAILKQ